MPHSFTLQPSKFEFDDFLKWQSGNDGSWNEDKQNISFFEPLKGRLNSLSSPTEINYSLDRRRDGKIDTASRREVLVERDLSLQDPYLTTDLSKCDDIYHVLWLINFRVLINRNRRRKVLSHDKNMINNFDLQEDEGCKHVCAYLCTWSLLRLTSLYI